MKRTIVRILGIGILLVLGYWGLVVALTVLKLGEPPAWTYGEGKFTRFKNAVRSGACSELISLLDKEQAEEFNRRRKELGFTGRYLDLKGLQLIGKDLRGVDLSKCILTGCDFSGCDLRGASFKKSYIPQTTF